MTPSLIRRERAKLARHGCGEMLAEGEETVQRQNLGRIKLDGYRLGAGIAMSLHYIHFGCAFLVVSLSMSLPKAAAPPWTIYCGRISATACSFPPQRLRLG